ncbi:MAG: Gfo/Idh/MocA family protein [Cyclobacteriaceae bacterium]
MQKSGIGFIGAGGIARAHAYALQALKFYYDDATLPELKSVTSSGIESREKFAASFGFEQAQSIEDFAKNDALNAVFILGPNKVHFEHIKLALQMPSVTHVYLEKPVCSTLEEEKALHELLSTLDSKYSIQIGFQFLQTPAVREALHFWKSGELGKPIHFDLKYYHGDYLQQEYRKKRVTRLTPAPDGGAIADLGSHGISLLMAFLGENLHIQHAVQSGSFDDVPEGSDLFSSITLADKDTHAVGNMSASRVSAGTGDLIQLEIYAEKGALKFTSHQTDYFEYFLETSGHWVKVPVGSHYKPVTSFPSGHVPSGWLRAMVHAHYLFLGGEDTKAFIPNLSHGLAVQRIVRETADFLSMYRKGRSTWEK